MIVMRKNQAFTMLEIMVVLFIIGLLATFGGPAVMRMLGKGEAAKTQNALNDVKSGLTQYNIDIGHYPKKEEGGLRALVEAPSRSEIAAKWDGPYVDEAKLVDAWGNDIEYNCPPEKHKGKYRYFEVISPGKEGSGKEMHAGG